MFESAFNGPYSLENAAIAVRSAVDSRGLRIMLLSGREMFDPVAVGERMREMMRGLDDKHVFIDTNGGTDPMGKETSAKNLALLANLYSEILKHRRETVAA